MEENKEKYEHGFKVPEGYFESFEETLFENIELEKLPKKPGFGVPKGYFDNLEDTILQKVTEVNPETKVVPLFRKKAFWFAASIAACIAFVFTVFNPFGEKLVSLEELSQTEIEAYMGEDLTSLDSYDLAQVLTDEDLESLEIENNYLGDENLEDYLLDNIDDPSILIE